MRRLAFVLAALLALPPAPSPAGAQPHAPAHARRYRAHRPRVTYHAPGEAGGASARCRDGSLSYSAHRRGTCSHHGGVVTWLGLR